MSSSSTTVTIPPDSTVKDNTGKAAPAGVGVAAAAPAAPAGSKKKAIYRGGWKKGVYVFDFVLRLAIIAAALAATITMGTTDETLPFFTQFFQFQATYEDLPALMFFVIANAIVSGYFVLSLPFSIVTIVRPRAVGLRLLLIVFDIVMVALASAAAAAAAAIEYLAHTGSSKANWLAICQQFKDFCQRMGGAVVASFLAALLAMLLVVMSALALRKP